MLHENRRWLLFFYTVSASPVNNRVKVWRRLAKAGAIQFKNSVYVLPFTEAHYEFFQWLLSEVDSVGGDGGFVVVEKFENIKDNDVIKLFDTVREGDYEKHEKHLDEIDRNFINAKMSSDSTCVNSFQKILERLNKLYSEFEEIKKIDFFNLYKTKTIEDRLNELKEAVIFHLNPASSEKTRKIELRKIEDFGGRRWVTRKKPYIDRLSSSWLIRRFIDKDAVIAFEDESKMDLSAASDTIYFDVVGGEFTHIGDDCTFEVLVKSFSIKDAAVKHIAELVHEIDMKDGKYRSVESAGVEKIISGMRKRVKTDEDLVNKATEIFDFLYESKK
ncbi:chromate resistance protein ChrB domain-containing protein [Candidatus Magnetomonas plexicatena]|uniref:chromate resistance protein ChrB domain-containing protein n=1 Tax=Candidatus Magnetomonas plexicatena TaxID=2552947 RepID=UPI001C75D13D|nr:chromate resistance protein [Nitrospirales bacterium LBB_01]